MSGNASLTVEDCEFSNNFCRACSGGAIQVSGFEDRVTLLAVNVRGSVFTNNMADNGGGVVTACLGCH